MQKKNNQKCTNLQEYVIYKKIKEKNNKNFLRMKRSGKIKMREKF